MSIIEILKLNTIEDFLKEYLGIDRNQDNSEVVKESESEIKDEKFVEKSFIRFDDNLSELILSYLTIKEKLIYESVSKKWKQLLFKTQKKLKISLSKENFETIKILNNNWNNESIIESLLKKFQFINEFHCEDFLKISIFEIIVNNCLNLEKIHIFGKVNENDFIGFGLKFGESLKTINVNGVNDKQLKTLLRFSSNLREVFVPQNVRLNSFIDIFLPKLEEIVFIDDFDKNGIKLFVDKYQNQIKRIKFICNLDIRSDFFTNLFLFENLEELHLKFVRRIGSDEVVEEFMKISKNCKNLKRLRVSFGGNYSESEMYKIFQSFRTLEELTICLLYGNMNFGNIIVESLKKCKKLRSLELIIPNLKDKHFDGIDYYLINLKKFSISERNDGITDNTLCELSKLQNLTKVVVNSYGITNRGVCNLIKDNPQIREIHVFDRLINDKTIDAFIEKSVKSPQIQYKLISSEECYGLKRITDAFIPKNLIIKK